MRKDTRWFVMVRDGRDRPVPLEDEDGSATLFESEEDADAVAELNPLAQAFGWDTYEWVP